MRPYGRLKKIKGNSEWKKDYHVHKNNKKIGNWWEDWDTILTRSGIKRLWRKAIEEDNDERREYKK